MGTQLLDREHKREDIGDNRESRSSTNAPLYIDVRTPQEFETVHMPEARNIPLPDLHKFVEELRTLSQQRPLLLVCRTQNRVRIAYEFLTANGIDNCSILDGGVTRWIEAGKPVVRGRRRISLEGQVRAIAGGLVLMGVALALTVHWGFLILPTLVGAGLLHAGLTDSCLMGMMLSKLPFNRTKT